MPSKMVQQMNMVEKRLSSLKHDLDDYQQVLNLMNENMSHGLSERSDISADLKMYITYVRSSSEKLEVGKFLALDLGGTNFRVLLIRLVNGEIKLKSSVFSIAEYIMVGPGKKLFDHIAECIKQFLMVEGIENEHLPMGFTFSFPCSQEGLDKSTLINWTKGFKCAGVEGEDIVSLLHEAIDNQKLRVRCVAVINDTVGAMVACAHLDKECHIGLILGTGTNACYTETTSNIGKWKGDISNGKQHGSGVIINTEWGAFGNNGCLDFLVSEYDRAVDENSKNPGEQIYEKMISGMYLGEVARQVIVQLIKDGCLFDGQMSDKINASMMFYTKYISEIESEAEHEVENLKIILDELNIMDYSLTDCMILKKICEVVSTRAAHLSAAGVAALLERVDRSSVTIAVDGSLYRYHPTFHENMTDMIGQLLPNRKFKLKLSSDGSGVGAALVAAISTKKIGVATA